MSTKESAVKRKVSAMLKLYGAYYEMPVPGGFGKSGLDYIGCIQGRFFSIETKAPGKHPTPRQEMTLDAIAVAGGVTFVISDEVGLDGLEMWLRETKYNDAVGP